MVRLGSISSNTDVADPTTWGASSTGAVTGTAVVDTMAALKAIDTTNSTNYPTGTTYLVHGYSAAGDGGGGMFRLNRSNTTGTDDGGVIIQPTTGVGRWERVMPLGTRYVNVKWWGALGNGTATGGQTAAQTYFKAAADYLIANNNRGGTVIVPAGVYNITAKIDLTGSDDYHYVNFVGLGHLRSWNQGYPSQLVQATLVAKTSGITILEYCSASSGSNKYGGPHVERIAFKDGTGASGVTAKSATGLRMNLCNDWSVKECSFLELKYGLVNYSHNLNKGRASGDSNFPVESGYERVTTGTDGDASWGHVHRCNFNDNLYGIFTPHSGGMVVDGECRFSIPEAGVGIAKYGGSQMRVLANKIDGETFGTSGQYRGTWSGSSISYLIGDYVVYQGAGYMLNYYKAKTNHTSASGSPPNTNTTDWTFVSTTFIESESEKDQVYGNQYEDVTTFYRCRDNGGTASGNNLLIYGNTGYGADSEVFIDAGAGTTGNRGLNSLTGVTSELTGPDSSGWTKAI